MSTIVTGGSSRVTPRSRIGRSGRGLVRYQKRSADGWAAVERCPTGRDAARPLDPAEVVVVKGEVVGAVRERRGHIRATTRWPPRGRRAPPAVRAAGTRPTNDVRADRPAKTRMPAMAMLAAAAAHRSGKGIGLSRRGEQLRRRRLTGGERRRQRVGARQRRGDDECRSRAGVGIAFEAAQDRPLHGRIEIVDDRRRRRHRTGGVELLQIRERLALHRAAAGEQLEQHQSQRVDVALDRRRPAGDLLGRHVLRRPGEAFVARCPSPWRCRSR